MEKVQDQEQTIEVFENDMQLYLSMFCEEQGIEDMRKEPQSIWNSALIYIQRHVFNNNILKSNTKLKGYMNNNYDNKYSNLNNSNCNSYNIELVNCICDYYIYLCFLYVKEVSIAGFCNLTGIDDTTIYAWNNGDNKLSSSGSVIYKKIMKANEECNANKLYDGKQNPVGNIAILNRRHGWASPFTSDSNRQKNALTASELPKLANHSSNCTMIESAEIGADQTKEPINVENKG